jgi:hypothetical protein
MHFIKLTAFTLAFFTTRRAYFTYVRSEMGYLRLVDPPYSTLAARNCKCWDANGIYDQLTEICCNMVHADDQQVNMSGATVRFFILFSFFIRSKNCVVH